MHRRSAEGLQIQVLPCHRSDHVRPGEHHVRHSPDHEGEIGECRGVCGSASARAHHHADLRNDPRRGNVPAEDPAIAGQRPATFLHPCPDTVVDRHQRRLRLNRPIDAALDLLRLRLPEASAEDPGIDSEGMDDATAYLSEPRHHAIGEGFAVLLPEAVRPVPT